VEEGVVTVYTLASCNWSSGRRRYGVHATTTACVKHAVVVVASPAWASGTLRRFDAGHSVCACERVQSPNSALARSPADARQHRRHVGAAVPATAHHAIPLPLPRLTMRVEMCRLWPHHSAMAARRPATSYRTPPRILHCAAVVTVRKMVITPAAASHGSATVAMYCSRKGGRHRHCSAPAPSGEADTVSAQPNSSRYARVPPAANAFSEPMACAWGGGGGAGGRAGGCVTARVARTGASERWESRCVRRRNVQPPSLVDAS
jgi:hypothetical protein